MQSTGRSWLRDTQQSHILALPVNDTAAVALQAGSHQLQSMGSQQLQQMSSMHLQGSAGLAGMGSSGLQSVSSGLLQVSPKP